MHPLAQLLTLNNTACHAAASSRKRVLQSIAALICADSPEAFDEDELFAELMARERLGSTGLGEGVAIPHCRLPCRQLRVALVTLPEPINYDAMDGERVDLLFVLVAPVDESQAHLDALATLAEIFSRPDNRHALRACGDNASLLATMQDLLNQQLPHSKSA